MLFFTIASGRQRLESSRPSASPSGGRVPDYVLSRSSPGTGSSCLFIYLRGSVLILIRLAVHIVSVHTSEEVGSLMFLPRWRPDRPLVLSSSFFGRVKFCRRVSSLVRSIRRLPDSFGGWVPSRLEEPCAQRSCFQCIVQFKSMLCCFRLLSRSFSRRFCPSTPYPPRPHDATHESSVLQSG